MVQSEYQNMIARQIEEPLYEQEKLNQPKDTLSKRIKDKLGDYPNKLERQDIQMNHHLKW